MHTYTIILFSEIMLDIKNSEWIKHEVKKCKNSQNTKSSQTNLLSSIELKIKTIEIIKYQGKLLKIN
jgi:hypothetical protein